MIRMTRESPLNFEVLPGARSYFKSIRRDCPLLKKFQEAIELLRVNPSLGDAKYGDLAGITSLDIRHNRTSYELAYFVEEQEDGELLLIIMAGTRENFFDELKRYLKKSTVKTRIK